MPATRADVGSWGMRRASSVERRVETELDHPAAIEKLDGIWESLLTRVLQAKK